MARPGIISATWWNMLARTVTGEIERAVAKCWEEGADPRLSRRIATHYLWPKVAQITAEAYDQVAR